MHSGQLAIPNFHGFPAISSCVFAVEDSILLLPSCSNVIQKPNPVVTHVVLLLLSYRSRIVPSILFSYGIIFSHYLSCEHPHPVRYRESNYRRVRIDLGSAAGEVFRFVSNCLIKTPGAFSYGPKYYDKTAESMCAVFVAKERISKRLSVESHVVRPTSRRRSRRNNDVNTTPTR